MTPECFLVMGYHSPRALAILYCSIIYLFFFFFFYFLFLCNTGCCNLFFFVSDCRALFFRSENFSSIVSTDITILLISLFSYSGTQIMY